METTKYELVECFIKENVSKKKRELVKHMTWEIFDCLGLELKFLENHFTSRIRRYLVIGNLEAQFYGYLVRNEVSQHYEVE